MTTTQNAASQYFTPLFYRCQEVTIATMALVGMVRVFAEDGQLASVLPAYRMREGQVAMAMQIEGALSGGQVVIEAGTGIGKTFAYLAPIIQSGRKALISTAARALQDQLAQRDIPLLTKALARPVSVAVLKGRRNYVCRLAWANNSGLPGLADDWQSLHQFVTRTTSGDIGEAEGISPRSPLWAQATSTRDSCRPKHCPYYDDCFFYRARELAKKSDIVIVNHHLFLSDVRLRDEEVAEILPTREVVIFDEAHMLPQFVPACFGDHLQTTALHRTAQDAQTAAARYCKDGAAIVSAAACVQEAIVTLCDAMAVMSATRWSSLPKDCHGHLATLREAVHTLAQMLENHATENETVETLAVRARRQSHLLTAWAADKADKENPVASWVEYAEEGLTFHQVPISGRHLLEKQWEKVRTLVFTSATLSVGGDFTAFCDSVGAAEAAVFSYDSPYDFPTQSLLYVPEGLPPPNDKTHTQALLTAVLPLIDANAGRTFLLFSSLRALEFAATFLPRRLKGYTLCKQGDCAEEALLTRFRTAERAVLLGSRTFWQGVDVKGDTLSLVVLDRIPFTPPDDPLLQARDDWRKQRGENTFMHNQLPAAAIWMKQVAGRLIRAHNDYGVFVVGDTRLLTHSYGPLLLRALPPMRHCVDDQQVIAFLHRMRRQ